MKNCSNNVKFCEENFEAGDGALHTINETIKLDQKLEIGQGFSRRVRI